MQESIYPEQGENRDCEPARQGSKEMRLSEDLEERDIKAGGDDFQKAPVKKCSLLLDVQGDDDCERGGG